MLFNALIILAPPPTINDQKYMDFNIKVSKSSSWLEDFIMTIKILLFEMYCNYERITNIKGAVYHSSGPSACVLRFWENGPKLSMSMLPNGLLLCDLGLINTFSPIILLLDAFSL